MSIRFAATVIAAFVVVGCSGSSDNIGPTNPQSFIKASAAGPTGVAVTTEMQTHAASFVVNGGAGFLITPAGAALLEP